jgi:FolB domain-containing protein
VDRIFIRDLLVRGIIGVNDWERETAQEILINVTVFTDTRRVGASDNLDDSVNYRTLGKAIAAHAEAAARFTVEALANDIASLCLKTEGVRRVLVRVEKPGALRFAESVGVEIDRGRDE